VVCPDSLLLNVFPPLGHGLTMQRRHCGERAMRCLRLGWTALGLQRHPFRIGVKLALGRLLERPRSWWLSGITMAATWQPMWFYSGTVFAGWKAPLEGCGPWR